MVKTQTDQIKCPVCEGTGMVSEKKILIALGGEEILKRIEMTRDEFFNKLNNDAPKLLSEIEKSYENKFEEKFEKEEGIMKKEVEKLQNQINYKDDKFEIKIEKERDKFGIELEKKNNEIISYREKITENDGMINEMREKITELQTKEKSVGARIGKQGELEFQDWIAQYPQFECSKKLSSIGDYLVNLKSRQINGDLKFLQTPIVIDNKSNKKITKGDVDKILRDVKQRNTQIGYLLVNSAEQFRGEDLKNRYKEFGEYIIIIGTREDFINDASILPRYLELIVESKEDNNAEIIASSLRKILIEGLDRIKNLKSYCNKVKSAVRNQELEIDKIVTDMHNQMLSITDEDLSPEIEDDIPLFNAKIARAVTSAAKYAQK